jgi:hypothetical protein
MECLSGEVMNISTIIDMLKADPSIENDILKFVERMNVQDQVQVVRTRDVVIDEERIVSIAELNGGPATEADVQAALSLIAQEPLVLEADKRIEQVKAAIASGEVTSSAELTAKFAAVDVASPVDAGEAVPG